MGKSKRTAHRPARPKRHQARPSDAALIPAAANDRPAGVVGIGASAGGLQALEQFIPGIPAETGLAFVLVMHLSPDQKSALPEILGRYTVLPIATARNQMPLAPDHLYLIPPGKLLTIASGTFVVAEAPRGRAALHPIDAFFQSLARERGEDAVGVVLSGAGTDGTLGLRAIKAAGGLTVAQDPDTAGHSDMPRSAIAAGAADHVLAADRIPELLARYARHPLIDGQTAAQASALRNLHEILAVVREQTGADFRGYRSQPLQRRLARQMALHQLTRMKDYLAFVREHPAESETLARSLLIGVTEFFRDPDAWRALAEQALAPLIRARTDGTPIRAWVVGCATGEEAYSLAMLLQEQLHSAGSGFGFQVFASDIDRKALGIARAGVYPATIASPVPAEYLERYFVKVNAEHYRVGKKLRQSIVFAEQNVLRDPPFAKLDLISCRNLLIYLEHEIQQKVLRVLHFALRNDGVLFLGASESAGQKSEHFEAISEKWHLYRRSGLRHPEPPGLPLPPDGHSPAPAPPAREPSRRRKRLIRGIERQLLQDHAPAAVLMSRSGEPICFFGRTEDYLTLPPGEPPKTLLPLVRDGIRRTLERAIKRAVAEQRAIEADVGLQHKSKTRDLSFKVEPLRDRTAEVEYLLITFEPVAAAAGKRSAASRSARKASKASSDQIAALRSDLDTAASELDGSREEFAVAREELMSANEELQATNEELNASKEELQALNEELTTVNAQLSEQIRAVNRKKDDLENLVANTRIPTLFLDRQFNVQWFTPAAGELFHLLPSDVGRPISDLAQPHDGELTADARQVLETLRPLEREVRGQGATTYLERVLPYRTQDGSIDGVVVTLTDITEPRRAEQTIRQLGSIVESSGDAILGLRLDGTVTSWNAGAERLYGYRADEIVGESLTRIIPPDRLPEFQVIWTQASKGRTVLPFETRHVCKDGRSVDVSVGISPVFDAAGRLSGASAIARDISRQKQAEQALLESEERLQAIFQTAADAIITIHQSGIIESVNPAAETMFGYTAGEMLGRNVSMLMPHPFGDEPEGYLSRSLTTAVWQIIGTGREVTGRRKDGSLFPVDLAVSEIQDRSERLFTGMLRDISERKAMEREVLEIASAEQQRIGQDLHDGTGQELTGLSLLAHDLAEDLEERSLAQAAQAKRIAERLDHALGEVRKLAKGLVPVEVEAEGLRAALKDLADFTGQQAGVVCEFVCKGRVEIADSQTATHLYRIAQEAVTNALRHSQGSRIVITLKQNRKELLLEVRDDGVGIPEAGKRGAGMGLRIMRYRAHLIGSSLEIAPADGGGTRVVCLLKDLNHAGFWSHRANHDRR